MHITAHIYLDAHSWPITVDNPCYSMIHCDHKLVIQRHFWNE